jgi:hypothetical protein
MKRIQTLVRNATLDGNLRALEKGKGNTCSVASPPVVLPLVVQKTRQAEGRQVYTTAMSKPARGIYIQVLPDDLKQDTLEQHGILAAA